MWLNRFRLFMAVFACLAFISQAFAVVDYRCIGMTDHPEPTAIEGGQLSMHQGHTMHDYVDASAVPDCCDHHQCSQVDCISAHSAGAAIVATPTPLSVNIADSLAADYSITYLTADASSLFRPPIAR